LVNATTPYKEISEKWIKIINENPKSTWTAGHNERFEDHNISDLRRLLGSKKPLEFMRPPLKT